LDQIANQQNGKYMTGTDTFHLGDGYYVYVNWQRNDHSGNSECYIWIGEDYKCALELDGISLRIYHMFTYPQHRDPIERAKQFFYPFILNYREQLKEIIREEEYWNHLLDSKT
jgi:hypothetical protein